MTTCYDVLREVNRKEGTLPYYLSIRLKNHELEDICSYIVDFILESKNYKYTQLKYFQFFFDGNDEINYKYLDSENLNEDLHNLQRYYPLVELCYFIKELWSNKNNIEEHNLKYMKYYFYVFYIENVNDFELMEDFNAKNIYNYVLQKHKELEGCYSYKNCVLL